MVVISKLLLLFSLAWLLASSFALILVISFGIVVVEAAYARMCFSRGLSSTPGIEYLPWMSMSNA